MKTNGNKKKGWFISRITQIVQGNRISYRKGYTFAKIKEVWFDIQSHTYPEVLPEAVTIF